jgi:hypothetical protein
MESRVSLEFRHIPKGGKHHANSHIDNGGRPSLEQTPFVAISVLLLISSQRPIAVQHIKSNTERRMSATRNVVHSAITAIHDEVSTTRNKWMTLDAWKTIMYHYYDFDDEMGFSLATLTRAVKLFGAGVDFKVNAGNSTGVHLVRLKSFVKYDKNGKMSGAQRVRFLLLSDSKETEPKEAIDISGWKREYKNSKAVIDKTSTLFVGIQALPSFEDRAAVPGSLNGADLKISELRKLAKPTPRVVSPIQETVDANLAAPRTTAAAPTATKEDPPSQVDANVAARTAAAEDPPSQVDANVAARTAAAAAPPNQVDANVTAGRTVIPPSCWDSYQARKLFQPRPEESVEACLQRRVEVLNSVFNDWSNLDQVVEGYEETVSRLTESQKQKLVHKCVHLRTAYEKALLEMGSGLVTWTQCTESTLKETKQFGLTTFSRPRSVADMNQDFRNMEFFSVAHSINKGFQGSEPFQIFPEAKRMLSVSLRNTIVKLRGRGSNVAGALQRSSSGAHHSRIGARLMGSSNLSKYV